jgi:hypothetical protein
VHACKFAVGLQLPVRLFSAYSSYCSLLLLRYVLGFLGGLVVVFRVEDRREGRMWGTHRARSTLLFGEVGPHSGDPLQADVEPTGSLPRSTSNLQGPV